MKKVLRGIIELEAVASCCLSQFYAFSGGESVAYGKSRPVYRASPRGISGARADVAAFVAVEAEPEALREAPEAIPPRIIRRECENCSARLVITMLISAGKLFRTRSATL